MKKTLLNLLIIVAGLIALGAGIQRLGASADLVARGVTTRGHVTEVEERSNWDNDAHRWIYHYRPVISFTATNHRSHRFRGSWTRDEGAWHSGQSVPIVYDPDQPGAAKINRFGSLYGYGGGLAVLGGVLTWIGVRRWRRGRGAQERIGSGAQTTSPPTSRAPRQGGWLRLVAIAGLLGSIAGAYWLFLLVDGNVALLPVENTLRYQGAALLLVLGATTAWLARGAARRRQARADLMRRYPGQPWLWREDWGRYRSYPSASVYASGLVFMLVWNLLVLPPVLGAYPKYSDETLFVMVFAYLFPVVGIGSLLWQAIRWLRQARRKARPLRLQNVPAVLGQELRGELSVPALGRSLPWECELVCLYEHTATRKTSRGYESRFVRDELWRTVTVPRVTQRPKRIRLSIAAQIDKDQPPTGPYADGEVNWVVIVRAVNRRGRVRYEREYPVPVFGPESGRQGGAASTSPVDAPGEQAEGPAPTAPLPSGVEPAGGAETGEVKEGASDVSQSEALALLENAGVRINGKEIRYDPLVWKRSIGRKVGIIGTLISSILLAVFGVLFVNEVIIEGDWWGLPLGLGVLMSLGFLGLSAFFGLHRYYISVDRDGITRHSSLLGYRWRQSIPWARMKGVGVEARGSSESYKRRIHYYGVVINPAQKRHRLAISSGFRDREIADTLAWLVGRMTAEYTV